MASIAADALRPFWLNGLSDVTGLQIKDLGGWICDENFQIYSAPSPARYVLTVADGAPVLEAYAAEVRRISIACLETLSSIQKSPISSKSIAWMVVKTYYAAFFASHTLIRMLGTAVDPIGPSQVVSVGRVAAIFGYPVIPKVRGGLHSLAFVPAAREIEIASIRGSGLGPHEAIWVQLDSILAQVAVSVLSTNTLTGVDRQSVSVKLDELRSNLCYGDATRSTWLSVVRNGVNYDQRWSTWYPYSSSPSYYPSLITNLYEWDSDPMTIDLKSYGNNDLRRFQATCNFIISLMLSIIRDMASRCSKGKSFHETGALAFLRTTVPQLARFI